MSVKDLKKSTLFDDMEKKLEWGMKNGQGKMNFVYAGLFKINGNLLPLNPPIFGKQQKEENITSINKFMEFFGIKDEKLGEKKILFDLMEELKLYDSFNS